MELVRELLGAMSAPSGTHKVRLAPSFLHGCSLAEEELIALRYNFQPSTLDGTLPSTISSSGGEYIVTRPSTDAGHVHTFKGSLVAPRPTKKKSSSSSSSNDNNNDDELDCVLVLDETTGTYTLHPLSAILRLDHVRPSTLNQTVPVSKSTEKVETKPRPPPPPATTTTTTIRNESKTVVEEIDEEDEDLDDLANLLESTLDESSSTIPKMESKREDESSEDED